MKEIRRIIKEYKEVIADPGISDYAKVMAKIHAFDEIVEEVESVERIKILKEQTEEDIKGFFEEDHLLNNDDDTLAGKWGKE